jgi:imidazolonepropionase-like amidohydrolase
MKVATETETSSRPWWLALIWLTGAAALVLTATPAGAQTVIRGGEVMTVSGDTFDEGTVVIGADGTIKAVGGADMDLPSMEGEPEVVDASGKVVTPGLVDVGTRLGLAEVWAVGSTRDHDRGGQSRIRAAFRTSDAFNPDSTAIPVSRTGGVTSAVIVPGGGIVAGQSAWIDLKGREVGHAHVAESPVGMHIQLGPRRARRWGLRSRAAVLEELRELYDNVTYFDEHREDFNRNRIRPMEASRLDLEALVPTAEGELPVVFHVNRADEILRALEFSDEVGLDLIIAGGAEAWKVADRLAERRVPVVVNPHANLPARFSALGARADSAALLAEAGVPVVISTFGTHNVRKLRQLAGNAVRAGLSHEEALRAVTGTPAAAFGQDEDYGSLQAGNTANVVVWSGDPFEMSSRVDAMFIDGESVTTNNRHRELMERYRTLERRGEPADERADDESVDSTSGSASE